MSSRRVNGDKGGFTLIELLIALAIGAVVMAGAVGMFQSQRVAFDLMNQMKIMEENGRVAMDVMARDIRRTTILPVDNATSVYTADNADAALAARRAALGAKSGTDILEIFTSVLREPVCKPNLAGVDGLITATTGAFTGLPGWTGGLNPATDDDVLELYSALIYDSAAPATNCTKIIDGVASASGLITTSIKYAPGANVDSDISGRTHNCAALFPLTSTACFNMGNDIYFYVNTNNELMRYVVGEEESKVPEVIASYVEDFQVSYAQDANADNLLTSGEWRHTEINATLVDDPTKVRMVKISLLMKSKNIDPAKTAALAPILENSTVAFGAADKYRRRVFTRTVRLRNMEVN
jgi:type IV pilus assembly protein PilW